MRTEKSLPAYLFVFFALVGCNADTVPITNYNVISEDGPEDISDFEDGLFKLRIRRVVYQNSISVPSDRGGGLTMETIEFRWRGLFIAQGSFPLTVVGARVIPLGARRDSWSDLVFVEYNPGTLVNGETISLNYGQYPSEGTPYFQTNYQFKSETLKTFLK